MITLTTAVVRAGKAEEWPGDVVTLCAGDMIPADMRIIVSHATLTRESLPVEKFDARETREKVPPLEFANICFLGTSVESGAAKRSCSQQARRLTLGAWRAALSGSRWRLVSTIPTDTVGSEGTAKPRPWHIGDIKKFVLSIHQLDFRLHDLFVMLYVFGCWVSHIGTIVSIAHPI
jgi:magnesium-transporting ATPase (P-type)